LEYNKVINDDKANKATHKVAPKMKAVSNDYSIIEKPKMFKHSRLVLKTTIITLAAIIGAFMITFGVLIMATPKTVAGIFDDIGGYSASVFFYEKQYDKTGSIEDLAVLVDKLDMEEEPLKVEGYLETLLSREDFKEYCEKKDANKPTLTTKEYYYGNYVIVFKNLGFKPEFFIIDSYDRAVFTRSRNDTKASVGSHIGIAYRIIQGLGIETNE
jgi:hypothetical protein